MEKLGISGDMRLSAAVIIAALVVAVSACSSGGGSAGDSGSGSGGCTTWKVSQDGTVVASEYFAYDCDSGPLLTQSAGSLNPVSGTPTHGAEVCNVPVVDGTGWKVYTGPNGDPSGEAQGVCGMFGQSVSPGTVSSPAGQVSAQPTNPVDQASGQPNNDASQQASMDQQQVSQDQQLLQGYITTLESDTSALTSTGPDTTQRGAVAVVSEDIAAMKHDLLNEQSDYQGEVDDSQSGDSSVTSCIDNIMEGSSSMVVADGSKVHGDLQGLQENTESSQQVVINANFVGVAVVQQAISNVNTTVAALRQLGQAPSEDPSQAIAAAGKANNTANSAAAQALQEGNAMDTQAQQIASEATTLASKYTAQCQTSNAGS